MPDDDQKRDPVAELRAEFGARFDQLGAALDELKTARTPPERREARREASETRDDLEAALRKAGYRFTRDELDDLAEEKEYRSFRARMKRLVEEEKASSGGGGNGDDDDGKGKGKQKTKKVEDEAPANRGGWLRM